MESQKYQIRTNASWKWSAIKFSINPFKFNPVNLCALKIFGARKWDKSNSFAFTLSLSFFFILNVKIQFFSVHFWRIMLIKIDMINWLNSRNWEWICNFFHVYIYIFEPLMVVIWWIAMLIGNLIIDSLNAAFIYKYLVRKKGQFESI